MNAVEGGQQAELVIPWRREDFPRGDVPADIHSETNEEPKEARIWIADKTGCL